MMRQPRHIAIAGGGIIGLACALALRLRHLEVTIFDAGPAAREASWAAGGMLAVDDPENPPELLNLSRYSRIAYVDFLQQIHSASGIQVYPRTRETVQVSEAYSDKAAVGALSLEQARELVPGLVDPDRHYFLLQEDSFDPREICTALCSAVAAAGATIREYERVLSVEAAGNGVSLATTRGAFSADAFVNCSGAWAAALAPSIAVGPSKGQMLTIAQPESERLTRVLRSPEVYLIPRGDDRIVVGATVEDAGYSKGVDRESLSRIRKRAAALWAPAATAPQTDCWAGLRPGTADGLPVIGTYDERGLQFVATGHFRNGILLAPGTAQVIADLVCGVTPAIDLAPFSPHRPSIRTACDKHFAAAL
jgi:glycine oxidase